MRWPLRDPNTRRFPRCEAPHRAQGSNMYCLPRHLLVLAEGRHLCALPHFLELGWVAVPVTHVVVKTFIFLNLDTPETPVLCIRLSVIVKSKNIWLIPKNDLGYLSGSPSLTYGNIVYLPQFK